MKLKFLAMMIFCLPQLLMASPEINSSERVVCETNQFGHRQNGEIYGLKGTKTTKNRLSLRIIPVPLSKKNRAAILTLSPNTSANRYWQSRGILSSKDSIAGSTLDQTSNPSNRMAATPIAKWSVWDRNMKQYVKTATFGLTKITGENEPVLFNDEYSSNANLDTTSNYSYILTLKGSINSPQYVAGLLTSTNTSKGAHPIRIKFRCFARGI